MKLKLEKLAKLTPDCLLAATILLGQSPQIEFGSIDRRRLAVAAGDLDVNADFVEKDRPELKTC